MEKTFSNNHRDSNNDDDDHDHTDTVDDPNQPDQPDHDQISAEIDNIINDLSTIDDKSTSPELPNTVDTFLEKIESMIDTYNSIKSGTRFAEITNKDAFFIDSIGRLSKLKTVLDDFSNVASFNNINKVLQLGIMLLEDEFRSILHDSNTCSDPITTKGSESQSSDERERESEHEHEHEQYFPGYSNEKMILMNKIVDVMIPAGYQYECSQAYSTIRRDELNEQIKRFEFDKVCMEDVHKSKWVTLEPDITRWVYLTNHCSHVLIVAEKKLGEKVFSQQHMPVFTGVLINLIRGITNSLLEFPTTVAVEKPKAKRLFKFLDVYEAICDINVSIVELGSGEVTVEGYSDLKSEISTVGDSIGEVVINMFNDLKNSISNDTNKTQIQGGAVHPLTRYVMGYIKCAIEDNRKTLECVYRRHVELGNEPSSDTENSNLPNQISYVIELLDTNLETKSTHYKDPSLRYIFLMNNNRYILQIVKESTEMKQLIGDSWCRRKSSDVRNYHKSYQRETWTKLLQWLTQEGVQVNGKPSRRVLKDRFKNFNAMFDDIHKTQSTWVVSDQQLLSEMRVSINAVVSPAYRSFVGRYRPQFEGGKSIDKYIKYQPEDIESMIESLFEGTEKVETQLNAIQALSTVKQTTGAFKNLLKTYKNVGLM